MMELHPVLIIALLPLAQYFFGVWGLILATPVAVYVIHEVILRRGLPGIDAPSEGEGPIAERTADAVLPGGGDGTDRPTVEVAQAAK